jgi:hypothetical protein
MTCVLGQIDSFIVDLERRKFHQNTLVAYRSDLIIAARHLLKPLDQTTVNEMGLTIFRG